MNDIKERILSSNFVNKGWVKKIKDYIYDQYISKRLESKTDPYRKEILNDFYEVFYGEKWMLGFGCFLRFYRDNTMDGQDIDVLISRQTFDLKKADLMKRGYRLIGVFSNCAGEITEYKLKYKEAEIDIFFVTEEDGSYYYASTYEAPEKAKEVKRWVENGNRIVTGKGYITYKKRLYDFETTEYEFQGMKFYSYKNVDKQLSSEYGNWHKPNPNFSFMESLQYTEVIQIPNAKVIYYKVPKEDY